MIKLEMDEPCELKASDTVFLLVSLYAIRFEAETRTFSNAPSRACSTMSNLLDSIDADLVKPGNGSKKRGRDSTGSNDSQAGEMDLGEDEEGDCVVLKTKKKPKYKEEENKEEEKSAEAKDIPSSGGHWSIGLLQYTQNPEKFGDVVIEYNDDWVVIKDKYPKSLLHLLILPRAHLPSFSHLTPSHLPLLKSMENIGKQLGSDWLARKEGKDVVKKNPVPSPQSSSVLVGFHAIPSMTQIHMHVISNDFDSISLKNKKHWNSFQPPFFISSSSAIEKLASDGEIVFNKAQYDPYLDKALACHRCGTVQANLPSLKIHIASCSSANV